MTYSLLHFLAAGYIHNLSHALSALEIHMFVKNVCSKNHSAFGIASVYTNLYIANWEMFVRKYLLCKTLCDMCLNLQADVVSHENILRTICF